MLIFKATESIRTSNETNAFLAIERIGRSKFLNLCLILSSVH